VRTYLPTCNNSNMHTYVHENKH